jgi:hypothetical protein
MVHGQKNHELRARGKWTNKIFLCLFDTFRWLSTYLCYIPIGNAKRRKLAHPRVKLCWAI